jgi:hypothetical protein
VIQHFPGVQLRRLFYFCGIRRLIFKLKQDALLRKYPSRQKDAPLSEPLRATDGILKAQDASSTQRPIVEVGAGGTSVVYVPLFGLWDFVRVLPVGLAVISYHHQTNQAQVSFPGLRPSTVQRIIDVALTQDGDFSQPDGSV